MARNTAAGAKDALASAKAKGREHKAPELPDFVKLRVGGYAVGTFVETRDITIKDKKTRAPKDIQMHTFADSDGVLWAISGRTMLDQALQSAAQAEDSSLAGMVILIERDADSETKSGNPMGNYTVTVLDGNLKDYADLEAGAVKPSPKP